eukprot:354997-Amphidinium_carterae.1
MHPNDFSAMEALDFRLKLWEKHGFLNKIVYIDKKHGTISEPDVYIHTYMYIDRNVGVKSSAGTDCGGVAGTSSSWFGRCLSV